MKNLVMFATALLLVGCSPGNNPGPTPDPGMEVYLRARSLYEQGDLSGARALLESRTMAHLPAATVLLGRTLYFLGREAEAAETLEPLIREAPNHVDAAKWLARSYLALGRPEESRQVVIGALSTSAEDAELLLLMGQSARDLGETQTAVEYYTKATTLSARLAVGHVELADIYRAAGIANKAAHHARRARSILGEGP